MKAYAITLTKNLLSVRGTDNLINSSKAFGNDFDVEVFHATTDGGPATLAFEMGEWGFKWNYPWDEVKIDIQSGLVKRPYKTKNPGSRIACALSHYRLWNDSWQMNETILVLEHDAIFIRKFTNESISEFENSDFGIMGINNPIGATRKASQLDAMIQHDKRSIQPIPVLDQYTTPQGLAGNSAYIIKPWAAKKLVDGVKEYGLWPNDAFMCKQLFPFLGLSRTYYTKVQGLPSTTT
jgi:hypothetical protein